MIYLDNAATTRLSPKVLEAMLPYMEQYYGNASSLYRLGTESKRAILQARRVIAQSLHVDAAEIYFTAGGSESDNWALVGVAEANRDKGRHIITTRIEHHAVLHTCQYLERRGFQVTYLQADEKGLVSPEKLERAIRPDTILISVMLANNEVGTIQPIEEIGRIAKSRGVLFHTDAVQAYGHLPIDVEAWGIDLLSASGHKLHGPKGVGFLYMRQGVKCHSLIHGGAQERGRRAGTENVPGIVGLGKAAELAFQDLDKRMEQECKLRDYLIEKLEREIPYCRLNGDRVRRLPNNIHVSFPFIEGESLLILLDGKGVCASSGSACTIGTSEPSHVLLAMGLPPELANGSLRLTLSAENTRQDMDDAAEAVKESVEQLRSLSAGGGMGE